MRNVAVIGAGAAGLGAALTLVSAGVRVTLYEREARAGGRMRTETIDGARVDAGVQLVSSSCDEFFRLSREAGVGSLLVRSPGRDALWRGGRAHGITYGSVTSMATSSALPTMLKLKMAGRYLPFLTSRARALDANDPARTGGLAHDNESIADWGLRELGREFVELLAYPLLAAYYGSTPEQTSAAIYHALARAGMDVSVYGAAGGFGAIVEGWLGAFRAAGGEYLAETAVTQLDASADAVRIVTSSGAYTHDGVVVAVPASSAAPLLAGSEAGVWLAGVRVDPTITIAFRMDRPFPGDYFGLSFPRTESIGSEVVALCIQSRKVPGLVPPGGDVLVALPAPTAARTFLDMEESAAAARVLSVLEQAVKGITKHVVSTHAFRFQEGYTLFAPGSLHHIARFDEAWLPDRVALAGDYLVAPTVEGAVVSGVRAAKKLTGV